MLDPSGEVPTIEDIYAADIDLISRDRHVRRTTRVLDIQGADIRSTTGEKVTSDVENRKWIRQKYENSNQPVPPWDIVTVGLMRAKDIVLSEMKRSGQA